MLVFCGFLRMSDEFYVSEIDCEWFGKLDFEFFFVRDWEFWFSIISFYNSEFEFIDWDLMEISNLSTTPLHVKDNLQDTAYPIAFKKHRWSWKSITTCKLSISYKKIKKVSKL
jgi:hypothetical protein